MHNVITVIGLETKWPPETYGRMYMDNYDEMGLFYWADNIEKYKTNVG